MTGLHRHLPALERYTRLLPALAIYRRLWRAHWMRAEVPVPGWTASAPRPRVLLIGAYLADRAHTADHLATRFAKTRWAEVTQRWVSLRGNPSTPRLAAVTAFRRDHYTPKFTLMNEILASVTLSDYDVLVVSDDDIVVPNGFADAYLAHQLSNRLVLAQPARTTTSTGSKTITVQQRGVNGRFTRFVEIGPLFSMTAEAVAALLPFDEQNPMGWGYDYRWPVVVEAAGWRMGIVDATPVDHSLRLLASSYSGDIAAEQMLRYLARHEHLPKASAEVTTGSF